MDAKECREAFEAWAKSSEWDFESLNRNGAGYHDTSANHAWHVWQAAWNRRADAQDAAKVDCIGLALDLEARAKTVESQTTERAMLAGANGLRLIHAAIAGEKKA